MSRSYCSDLTSTWLYTVYEQGSPCSSADPPPFSTSCWVNIHQGESSTVFHCVSTSIRPRQVTILSAESEMKCLSRNATWAHRHNLMLLFQCICFPQFLHFICLAHPLGGRTLRLMVGTQGPGPHNPPPSVPPHASQVQTRSRLTLCRSIGESFICSLLSFPFPNLIGA